MPFLTGGILNRGCRISVMYSWKRGIEMNHIYKVVWSKARNCYMAVSEIAKGHQKGSSRTKGALKTAVLGALTAVMLTTGGVAGNVWAEETITIPEDNTVTSTDSKTAPKDLNANIKGKKNKVTNAKDTTIIGDNNEIDDTGDKDSDNTRIFGSGNIVKGSSNQVVIGDKNEVTGRGRSAVSGISDITIGQGNQLNGARHKWDTLTVIGNNNKSTSNAGAGIVIGDNQNLDSRESHISESIVIGSLSPEEQNTSVDGARLSKKYIVSEDSTIIGYHARNNVGRSIVIGNRSEANGILETVTGPRSVIERDEENPETSGIFASSYGSMNLMKNEANEDHPLDSVGNSINGSLNRTSNATGTLIMGNANNITNSQVPAIAASSDDGSSISYQWEGLSLFNAKDYLLGKDLDGNEIPTGGTLYDQTQDFIKNYMNTSAGGVSVLGNGNTADYAMRSQIIGTGNTLKGTAQSGSIYNTVSGFANVGSNITHTTLVGTGNSLSNGEDNVVIGDYHQLDNGKHNVILGSRNAEEKDVTKEYTFPDGTVKYTVKEKAPVAHKPSIENAVMLGYNTDVSVNSGVAIGAGSVSTVDKGQKGYYIKHDQRIEEKEGLPFQQNSSAWISRAGAVSVGDTTNADQSKWITRQITGVAAGTNDTDAVNVAQLKNSQTKYFSIYDPGDDWLGIFPQIPDWAEKYKNENNQGATNYWGMAAGFGTSTDGLASTVIGSLSRTNGDMSSGGMQGAASVSVGTFNFNLSDPAVNDAINADNPDTKAQTEWGVANSIVGQVNLAKNSNGALIYGAGNVVTNSYRDVDGDGGADGVNGLTDGDMQSLLSDPVKAVKVVGKLIDSSGGKAMVLGGGNVLDKAYSTQVIGVGNTVTGSDLNFTYQESPEIGKITNWAERDAAKTADIWNQYEASLRNNGTRLNYVDGYYSTLKNGQNDYMIGTANEVTGDDASKNKSNIVFGDYHKLKNGQNNIIIGSADGSVEEKATPFVDDVYAGKHVTTEITGQKQHAENLTDAVIIGHNADVQKNGGVALGSNSVAATDEGVVGLDLNGKDHSSDTTGTWISKAAAVSVGDSTGDEKITRQITNVAAGKEDTDAVNVAQLKQVSDMINNNTNTSKVHYYSVKSVYTGTGSNYDNDGAKGQESMVLGIASSSDAAYSTVIGMGSTASKRSSSIGSGMYDTVVGQYLHTTGSFNNVFGTYYHGIKDNQPVQMLTEVYGDRNTVLGVGNQVGNKDNKSDENTVIGMTNKVEGSGSIIVGNSTNVLGLDAGNATSIGHVNNIYGKNEGGGQWGVALGNHLTVKGEYALAAGNDSTAQGDDAVAIGHSTSASGKYALAMGSSSTASSKSTAIGYKATAQNDAIAIGDSAKAGNNGIAVGMHAKAGYDGQNMALGYYASVANGVRNSTALGYGSQVTKRDILKSDGSDGVISVGRSVGQSGEKGLTRRIINVKAGVNDTDAVNVSQLKTAASEVKGGTNIASVTTEKAADGHTIYTVNAKGTEVTGDSNFTVNSNTDEKTNITTYGLALSDTITIGKGKDAKPITIDGTKGEITGLTNRDTNAADFAKAGRAATEEQLDAMHNTITGEDRYVQSGTIDTTSGTMKLAVANGKAVDITGLTDYQLDTDSTKTKYDATAHKLTLSMKDTLNTGNLAKSVEFDGIANTADVAKAKTEIRGGTNIASLGTETAADGHTIYTVNAKGTEVKGDSNFTITPSTDEKTNITTYNLALNDTITIGKGKDAKPIIIDGTKGEITGLTNTTWKKDGDYSKSTKAATEAQIQSAVNAAKEDVKASDVDTHVRAGSYKVDTDNKVSMDIVDKNGKPTGAKVTIINVAKASEVGKLSDLDKSITRKSTVVEAINSVNTKVDNVDKKVGDLDYSSTNYVAKDDSATTAIGKLDAAIKDASSVANNITGGSNIDVSEVKDDKGHVTGHKVALKDDISLNSVTAKTVKADEVNTKKLTVSDSAAIGSVSINKDGKGTVNGLTNTTWNADKITSGQAATEDQLKAATKNAVNYDGDDSKTVTLRQDTTIKNVADTSIEKGSRNAVNAGTVYNETRVANDGHYIKAANTAGANITALDNQVAANAGNIFNLDNRVGELGSRINKVGAGAAALAALATSGTSLPA